MWKVGDRAILVGLVNDAELNGTKVTILSALRRERDGIDMVHEIDIPPDPGFVDVVVAPQYLRPIPDDYTRFHEALIASQWSDCEFNPMVTVESRHE